MIQQPSQLISVDAMRGFTIAAMLVANFPGSEEFVYVTLRQPTWNDLSFTDLIALFFLLIVGVSLVLAYAGKRNEGRPTGELYRKVVLRSVKILAVGLFLNLLTDFDFATIRWMGTRQRIASLSYALFFVSINFIPAYVLYQKKIFLKL